MAIRTLVWVVRTVAGGSALVAPRMNAAAPDRARCGPTRPSPVGSRPGRGILLGRSGRDPHPFTRLALVESSGGAGEDHEGPGAAGVAEGRQLSVRGVGFEFRRGPVEPAQEVVRRVAEDRVLSHP